MEKRENLFKRVVKRIENFASFIFKRQTDELPAYTEEEFDKDLEQVLDTSNDPDETTVIDESKKLLHPTVPEIQKITDQQKIPTPDTSRGTRSE